MPSDLYVVAYTKIQDDKDVGVYLNGVYFGGAATSHDEAEQIAKDVVNSGKGGTILAKILPTDRDQVLRAMEQAKLRFHQLEQDMFEAEEIFERNQARRRH